MQVYKAEVPNILSGSVVVSVRYHDHPSNGNGQYWIDVVTEKPDDRRRKPITHSLDRNSPAFERNGTYEQRYQHMIRHWVNLIGVDALNQAFQGAWNQMNPPMVAVDALGTLMITQ